MTNLECVVEDKKRGVGDKKGDSIVKRSRSRFDVPSSLPTPPIPTTLSSRPDTQSNQGLETPNQWLLVRKMESGQENSMLLMEHLGDTSAMVESLTHQLDSWSLVSTHSSSRDKSQRKASKRAIMKTFLHSTKKTISHGTNIKAEEDSSAFPN